jgi:hypothetical protein
MRGLSSDEEAKRASTPVSLDEETTESKDTQVGVTMGGRR